MGLDTKRGKDLEATREALASWRQTHGGRGRPIPPALWSKAADVARGVGVPEVARALRLDAGRLARLVEGGADRAPRREVEPADFVELGGLELGTPREPRRTVLELVGCTAPRSSRGIVPGCRRESRWVARDIFAWALPPAERAPPEGAAPPRCAGPPRPARSKPLAWPWIDTERALRW